jgi:dipeptidyl aminopeptidase/acylaminoacyl peptidase
MRPVRASLVVLAVAAGCQAPDPGLHFALLADASLLDEVDHFDLRVWAGADASCMGAQVMAGSAPPVAEQPALTAHSVTITVAAGPKVFAVDGFADAAGRVQIARGCAAATLEAGVPAQVAIQVVRVGGPPPRIVLASNSAGFGQTALYVVDPSVGPDARRITMTPLEGAGDDYDLAGTALVFTGLAGTAQLFAAHVDGAAGDAPVNQDGPVAGCLFSPDGQRIAYASRAKVTSQVEVTGADGASTLQLSSGNVDATRPAWSRDGAKVAWVAGGKVLVSAPTGGKVKTLAAPSVADGARPAWTADGKLLLALTAAGGADLVAWDPVADARGATLGKGLAGIRNVAIAPTGGAVLFAVTGGGGGDIWLADVAGAKAAAPLIATGANEDYPAWSPDGTRIAYTADHLAYTANPDGSGPKRVTTTAPGFAEVRPLFAPPAP